jgi:hypothetical protein
MLVYDVSRLFQQWMTCLTTTNHQGDYNQYAENLLHVSLFDWQS